MIVSSSSRTSADIVMFALRNFSSTSGKPPCLSVAPTEGQKLQKNTLHP